MSFTETAWSRTAALRQAIHELAFNRELAAGSLAVDRFRFYIAQDSLYLKRYARVLSACAARSPSRAAVGVFAHSAYGAIEVEQSMHAGFLEQFGVEPAALAEAEMSPTCQAYTDFLVAAAYEQPYCVAVAAVLPCFWIYADVGKAIAARAAGDNPYRAWIDTYADEAFEEAVRKVIRLTDEAADAATGADRDAMFRAFRLSTEYEYLFWDSAYKLERWPTEGLHAEAPGQR